MEREQHPDLRERANVQGTRLAGAIARMSGAYQSGMTTMQRFRSGGRQRARRRDGFRIIARKEGDLVRLWSRNGRDWSAEFVAITTALRELPANFVLDGEAVAHCSEGLPPSA